MALPIAKLLAKRQARQEMSRLVQQGFGPGAPTLTRLIKHDAKGRVAVARWRGETVIVKEIHAEDRPAAIAALRAEHDRLRPLFPQGRLQFVAYLATAAEQGLVILPFAPGERLDEAMRAALPSLRPQMVQTAVAWLVRSMEGRRETGRFSPDFWLGRLKGNVARANLRGRDAVLVARVLAGLQAMAPGLDGGPVPRGPVHGDFSSQNMFWDAATGDLHVFDVQSRWMAPLAIDLTWLLADLSYKSLRDDPATALDRGLAVNLRRAAMSVPGLDHPDNPGGFMDFMTGQRHATVLLGKLDHRLGPYVRRAMEDWLERFSTG